MAWIEAHQELARHPKVKKCARALGIPKAQMIGHLLMLWWWALDFAPDGRVADPLDIVEAAEWPVGTPTVFVQALVDHGFLDELEAGWCIHDWHDYAGKTIAAARVQARKASEDGRYGNHVRWHNESPSADCPWCSPPESPPSRPPSRVGSPQHSTVQNTTAAASPSYPQLVEVAEAIVDERIAEGYDVQNRDALVRSIAKSEEATHRWHKQQRPADMGWTGIGGDL